MSRKPLFLLGFLILAAFPTTLLAIVLSVGNLSISDSAAAEASTSNNYTVGNGVVYKGSDAVLIKGANWFGSETPDKIQHGLWQVGYKATIQQMKSVGINALRIPFCPDTIKSGSSTSYFNPTANPELVGKDSLTILDTILIEISTQKIHILLDFHRPAGCGSITDKWYTDNYTEAQWIEDLKFVANRYKNLDYFMGIDLKNEPHGTSTWGTGNTSTDWNTAAEKAGAAILAVNPKLLIFVEGIQENPVCSDASNNHWWGGNLEPFACAPISTAKIPTNKLVLSPHVYGPDVYNQPYFNVGNFPSNMPAIWNKQFGYLVDQGYTVIPGEWGGKYGNGGEAKDKTWQDALVAWYKTKGICNSFYWSWNPNSGDTAGILKDDWATVWQNKVDMLNSYWSSCTLPNGTTPTVPTQPTPTPTPVPTPTPTPTPSPTAGNYCDVQYKIGNQWNNGFVAELVVKNNSANDINNWKVTWSFPGDQKITQIWNGKYVQGAANVTVTPEAYNSTISKGNSIGFGFVASYSGTNNPLSSSLFKVNDVQCGVQATIPTAPAPQPPTPPVSTTPTTPVSNYCKVEYTIANQWGDGFVTEVKILNTSGSDIKNWTVTWNFSGNQSITNIWNASHTQNGTAISAKDAGYNATISKNGSTSFGFQGKYSGTNAVMTSNMFKVNGNTCN